jgi:biotin transporter BioY
METQGKHQRTGSMSWHDRPVLAPMVYGVSTLATGSLGYLFGFLLMDTIRHAIAASLFMELLLVLYLRASHHDARRRAS